MQRHTDTHATSKVTVVLVNMVGIFVDLLRSALAAEGTVHVIGSAATEEDLASIFTLHRPDLALVGAQGWGHESNALPFLQQITHDAPSVRTIVMASEIEREDVVAFFQAGARGLLCGAQADIPLLTKCMHCVSRGQIWADAAQLELLLRSLSMPRSLKVTNVLGLSLLSKREEQVLHLLADGLSNRELAAELKLSEHTVKNHLFRIFDKLGVSNRMEAVLYAINQRDTRSPHQSSPRPN